MHLSKGATVISSCTGKMMNACNIAGLNLNRLLYPPVICTNDDCKDPHRSSPQKLPVKCTVPHLMLMMLLTICSVRGATNWSGREWSRQNLTATASAESPSFISIYSTTPSSISTVMARSNLRSSDSFSVNVPQRIMVFSREQIFKVHYVADENSKCKLKLQQDPWFAL